jgi:hypothetical protein
MFIANGAFWFGAFVLGVLVTLASLQFLGAKQIEKNNPVKVVTFRNGQYYKFACSTIRDAAAYALKCLATGEGVASIEVNGETVWNLLKGKQSLVELAK